MQLVREKLAFTLWQTIPHYVLRIPLLTHHLGVSLDHIVRLPNADHILVRNPIQAFIQQKLE